MRFVLVHGGHHGAWCWEKLTPELREQVATFMRMAATFAKMAAQHENPALLEAGCRILNRAMADCQKDGSH